MCPFTIAVGKWASMRPCPCCFAGCFDAEIAPIAAIAASAATVATATAMVRLDIQLPLLVNPGQKGPLGTAA